MTDVAQSPAKATPKKPAKSKSTKEKAPAAHPKYIEMAVAALNSLKERGGSSRQAIIKYITSNYSVGQDAKVVATHLKLALKRGVESGLIKHVKGTGASGSFKANPEAKKKEKKPKKSKVAKKAKVTKPKKAKAAKSPSKTTTTKKAAKPAAKSIAKASKSPAKSISKASKSPAKKAPKKASPAKVAKPKKAVPGAKKVSDRK